jgi:hypothetical protein
MYGTDDMARGVAIGVLLGLAAGWLVFGNGQEPHAPWRSERPEAESDEPQHDLVPRLVEAPRVEATDAKPVDVPAAWSAVERARQERDWAAFKSAVQGLAGAATPDAQRRLLALLADETLKFHDPIGYMFAQGLWDTELDGVGPAALRRAKAATDNHDLRQYLTLIARHGGEAELVLLDEYLTGEHEARQRAAETALVLGAANPPTARRLEKLHEVLDRERADRYLTAIAQMGDNPALAARVARRELATAPRKRRRWLYIAYGTSATADDARAFLPTTTDVLAVHAVHALRERGIDLPEFAPIDERLLAALRDLGRSDPGRERRMDLRSAVTDAVWTRETVAALEIAARHYPDEFQGWLDDVRQQLGPAPGTWDPGR